MKVTLLNPEQVKDLFKNWSITSAVCYGSTINPDNPEAIGKHCMKSGHFSGSRGDYIKFRVDDVDRACYDGQTEILTSEGWKYFKDISDNEIVATLNPETKLVEMHEIKDKISYEYDGLMYDIKNTMVDLSITYNHNLYLKAFDRPDRQKKHNWELTKCENSPYLFSMTKDFNYTPLKKINDNIIIPGFSYNKKQNNGKFSEMRTKDLIFNRKAFYKFLAWYLSDGSFRYVPEENKYVITISQTECKENQINHTREDIINLIEEMGLTPTPTKNDIKITNLTLGNYLSKLGHAGDKYIPFNLFDSFDKEYAEVFLKEYFRADGHIDKNGVGFFYSGSFKLASQLQILCFMAGWTAMLRERNQDLIGKKIVICGREVNVNLHSYVVNVSFNRINRYPTIKKAKHFTIRKTKENVYCVNVPNHIVFVRKNGRAVWCGNCTDQAVRHEIGVFKNVASFRYISKNEFRYSTPVEIFDNQELFNRYNEHMDNTMELYSDIQDYVYKKTGSHERANESARYVLPMSTHTSFVIGYTIEAFIHLCNSRLCVRAEDNIREMTTLMKQEVLKVLPELEDDLVPNCVKLMYCPEGKTGCGAYPTKKQVEEYIKLGKKAIEKE